MSSYTYLKNLPVDLLKIEGEFVRRMMDDPIEAAIVASINQVGHVVGLETVAECVETEEIFEAVRKAGIDYAQGYWLARPAPLVTDTLLRQLSLRRQGGERGFGRAGAVVATRGRVFGDRLATLGLGRGARLLSTGARHRPALPCTSP